MKTPIKTTKNTIVKIFIDTETSPEVDFEMYDDVLGAKEVKEIYDGDDGVQIIDQSAFYHNIPIKIDMAIDMLNKLKEKGANYASIDHNCDHPDYSFEGFIIRKATEEDIDGENRKEKEMANKKAEALRKQAQELLDKANNL